METIWEALVTGGIFLGAGIGNALLYIILDRIRVLYQSPPRRVSVEVTDLIFWVGTGFMFFLLLLKREQGRLRLYPLVFFGLGRYLTTIVENACKRKRKSVR